VSKVVRMCWKIYDDVLIYFSLLFSLSPSLVLPVSFIIVLCALNEFLERLRHIIVFSAYQWYRFRYDIGVDCCDNNLFVINDGSVRNRHQYLYLSTKYKSKCNNERKPDDYNNIEWCQWSETFKLLSPCSIRWVMNDSIKFSNTMIYCLSWWWLQCRNFSRIES